MFFANEYFRYHEMPTFLLRKIDIVKKYNWSQLIKIVTWDRTFFLKRKKNQVFSAPMVMIFIIK